MSFDSLEIYIDRQFRALDFFGVFDIYIFLSKSYISCLYTNELNSERVESFFCYLFMATLINTIVVINVESAGITFSGAREMNEFCGGSY